MAAAQNIPPETLSALLDASTEINSARGLDETLDRVARAAVAVMRAEASSVILLDRARGKQVFRAAVGDRADQVRGFEFDAGAGISGQVLREGEPALVHDVSHESTHFGGVDSRTGFQTRSLIAAPLVHDGRVLGVVEVINPLHRDQFEAADVDLCRVFANLAAVATANAELLEKLQRENLGLRTSIGHGELIGHSPPMENVRALIRQVARSAATVLVAGRTGTGKELAARMIHAASDRAERPFIAINCAALPEQLLESELFGHEAGAFTGALQRKLGRFELADGGTLFLDEVSEMDPPVQAKLLRVLEEKAVTRVGGTQLVSFDVRLVAATNRDLEAEVAEGRFRDDLFYRLNVFPIEMPELKDRRDDIPLLAEHFVEHVAEELKLPAPAISEDAMRALLRYDFPGNVRELRNLLERACLLGATGDDEPGEIRPEHLPPELVGPETEADAADTGRTALEDQERALIVKALRDAGWNQSQAARDLGISRDNLRYRMKKYDVKRPS